MRLAEIFTSRQGEGLLTATPSVFVRASGCNLRCWFCDTPYTSWQPEGEDWSVDKIVAEVERLVSVGWDQRAERAPAHHLESGGPAAADHRSAAVPALSHRTATDRQGRPEARPTIGHVVLTGGEPMLFAELVPLCERLHAAGLHLTIETAGTVDLPVICDLMSISPKLASSTPSLEMGGAWSARHERDRHQPAVIRRLMADYDYQLKFVIDTPADCEAVEQWLTEFPAADRSRVLLMPQGIDVAALAAIAEWLVPYCEQHDFVYCPRKHIEWYGAVRGT